MSSLELRISPLGLLTACAIGVAAFGRWMPIADHRFPGQGAVAVSLIVLGFVIAAAGVAEFRRHKTTVNPLEPSRSSSVVRTGIYRYTRNPMYLGMALVLLGVAVFWASAPGSAIVAAFCFYIQRFQIVPEERALQRLFGEEFASYRSRVRRWI